MVETREHKLAKLAVEECLKKVVFGDVLILTDRPTEFMSLTNYADIRFKTVPDWPNKLGWSRAWWFQVPPLLRTKQSLNIQWDSWVWDTSMWSPEFLSYDYVGAPWWYKDGRNVGNGGFCLRSTALGRYIYDRQDQYPCDTNIDDDLLCRKYRPRLEDVGFVWAPEAVAHNFAFECCRPSKTSRHFGFHAAFNFGEVLDRPQLLERARLMFESPYIRESYIGKTFCEKYPDVVKELLDQELASGEAVAIGPTL